jgi:serine/threonine protein kinase
LATIKREVELL